LLPNGLLSSRKEDVGVWGDQCTSGKVKRGRKTSIALQLRRAPFYKKKKDVLLGRPERDGRERSRKHYRFARSRARRPLDHQEAQHFKTPRREGRKGEILRRAGRAETTGKSDSIDWIWPPEKGGKKERGLSSSFYIRSLLLEKGKEKLPRYSILSQAIERGKRKESTHT